MKERTKERKKERKEVREDGGEREKPYVHSCPGHLPTSAVSRNPRTASVKASSANKPRVAVLLLLVLVAKALLIFSITPTVPHSVWIPFLHAKHSLKGYSLHLLHHQQMSVQPSPLF